MKPEEPKVTALFADIGEKRYRLVKSRTCQHCAFACECYSVPRRKKCPAMGGHAPALQLGAVYKEAKLREDPVYAIVDASGGYWQGGNMYTDFAYRATLFRSKMAADLVARHIPGNASLGDLAVVQLEPKAVFVKKEK